MVGDMKFTRCSFILIILVLDLSVTLSSSFRTPSILSMRLRKTQGHWSTTRKLVEGDNKLLVEPTTGAAVDEQPSSKDMVRDILNVVLSNRSSNLSAADILNANLATLTDNSKLLTQSQVYEEVMDDIYRSCDGEKDIELVRQIDDILRSFIMTERKKRSRTKLTYLLAGATTGELEYTVSKLKAK